MNRRVPRFEIVRSDDGWHTRFRAVNGRIVWTTETYKHRDRALHAVYLITGRGVGRRHGMTITAVVADVLVEVRDVDERTKVPS